MQYYTSDRGLIYEVSDAYGQILPTGTESDDVQAEIRARRSMLAALADFLDGSSADEALLVPGATLDRVRGQEWAPDTCGCRVTSAFDGAAEPNSRSLVPHRIRCVCPAHAKYATGINGDVSQRTRAAHVLHDILLAENRRKNRAVNTLAYEINAQPLDITWRMDEVTRDVVISHSSVKTDDARSRMLQRVAAVVGSGVRVE